MACTVCSYERHPPQTHHFCARDNNPGSTTRERNTQARRRFFLLLSSKPKRSAGRQQAPIQLLKSSSRKKGHDTGGEERRSNTIFLELKKKTIIKSIFAQTKREKKCLWANFRYCSTALLLRSVFNFEQDTCAHIECNIKHGAIKNLSFFVRSPKLCRSIEKTSQSCPQSWSATLKWREREKRNSACIPSRVCYWPFFEARIRWSSKKRFFAEWRQRDDKSRLV